MFFFEREREGGGGERVSVFSERESFRLQRERERVLGFRKRERVLGFREREREF